MNDLSIIARLNSQAVAASVPARQAQGFYVVVEYRGLHFIEAYNYVSESEANQRACAIDQKGGSRSAVYPPAPSKSI